MLARLIGDDRVANGKLLSFVRNMVAVIEFDAHRKGRLISGQALDWNTERVAISVTDGLEHFIGHEVPHPVGTYRLLAAKACHISHLLRDFMPDVVQGFINIPREYIEAHVVEPGDVGDPHFQIWVSDRASLAREYFRAGKQYFDQARIVRTKLVVSWYCARFERVLDAIERDDFILCEGYRERKKLPALLKLLWLCVPLSIRHASGQSSHSPNL